MSAPSPEHGWSAADVDPAELVDDDWIARETSPLGALEPTASRGAVRGPVSRDMLRRIAARTGYPVVEAWSARNVGQMSGVRGALCHHTGTAWSAGGDYPTLRIVRDGRPDLQNSLCAFGLGRSGTVYLVSEKLSWHAGSGSYNGLTDGNSYLLGIEAESDGAHWTAEQVDAYPRLVASILVEIGSDRGYTCRHADWAPSRKTDFSGWPAPLAEFWGRVEFLRTHPDQIPRTARPEADVQLTDSIPNANPETKAKTPTTSVANVLQDTQANAWYAARNTAGLSAAVTALAQLVAQQNGLTLDDVHRAVAEEIAKGVSVTVKAGA